MVKKLKVNSQFIPCEVGSEDELFINGIFVFNITKIIEYLKVNPDKIVLEMVPVNDFWESPSIDPSYVDSVDISKPLIVAEMSPGRYNLIDGNHRMAKALKMGIRDLPAYRLNVQQHIKFLTEKKAYLAYIEYWNSKLKQLIGVMS